MPNRGYNHQDLLRVVVGGSVDHGKSSLIGRLLLDSEDLYSDQVDEVTAGELAFATDGLRDERELGLTIDVAHRYFSTPARGFVLADTPGHLRYTRNMVTGASKADLLVLVVDITSGPYESPEGLNQGFTHAFVVTFAEEGFRDAYLEHPDHEIVKQMIVKQLAGNLANVIAFDFKVCDRFRY